MDHWHCREGQQVMIEKLNQTVQLTNSFRTARIIDKPRVIEVPAKEKEGELW